MSKLMINILLVAIGMIIGSTLYTIATAKASKSNDPYPIATPTYSSTIMTIYEHTIAPGTITFFELPSGYVMCSTETKRLNCHSVSPSTTVIQSGEIHIVTAADIGYICTVAGCQEFSW